MLLAYQLNREGTLEKIAQPFLEYLVSKNVLVFYAQKIKHLYIWIGRNASQTVKSNIANIQARLLQLHPGSTFLRQITIEDGSEPHLFLELLSLSKDDIQKKEDEFKQFRQKEIEEVRKGINTGRTLFESEKVEDAYQTLSEMLQRAVKLDNDELVEQAETIYKMVKAKKEWLEKLQIAKKELENYEKYLDDSLSIEKASQAYEYSEKIRMLVDYQKGLEITPVLKEKIEKARTLYEEYQEKSNFTERTYFLEKAKFEEAVSYKDFEAAHKSLEKMKEVASNAMDVHLKEDYEKNQQSYLPQYEKWLKEKEESQKEEFEIRTQIDSIKKQLDEAISKEDVEKTSNLITIIQTYSTQTKNEAVQNEIRKIQSEYKQKLQKIEDKIRISKEIAEDLKTVENYVAEESYDTSLKTLQNDLIQAEQIEATSLIEQLTRRIQEISQIKQQKQEYDETVKRLSIQIDLELESLELDSAEINAKKLLHIAESAKDEPQISAAREKLEKITTKKIKMENIRKNAALKKQIEEINTKDHAKLADSKIRLLELLENPEINSNEELNSLALSKLTLIKNFELKSEIIAKIQSVEKEIQNKEWDSAERDCKILIQLAQSSLYDEERTFAEMKFAEIQRMKQENAIQKEKEQLLEEINKIPEPNEQTIDEILNLLESKKQEEKLAKYPEIQQVIEEKHRKILEMKEKILEEKKNKEIMQKIEAIPDPNIQNVDTIIKEIDTLLETTELRENNQAKAKLEEKKNKALEIKERAQNEEKIVKANLEEISQAIHEFNLPKAEKLLKETQPKMQFIKDDSLTVKIQEYLDLIENKKKEMKEKKEKVEQNKENAKKALDEKNYQEAITSINQGIELAEQIHDDQMIVSLNALKQQIEIEKKEKETIEQQQKSIEKLIEQAEGAYKNKNFEEVEAILQKIRTEYPKSSVEPFNQKIDRIDKNTTELKKKQHEKLTMFNQIKATMEAELNEDKYLSASENCKILVRMADDLGLEETEKIKLTEKSKSIEELLQKEREKKKLEREQVLKTLEAASTIMETEKDILPDIVELSIQDSIGNISDDLDSMMTALNSVLETQRVEIKNEVSSKSILKSKSGEIIELERKSKVVESSDTATQGFQNQTADQPVLPTKGPVKISFTSGLENPLDDVIEEAILQDVIPYNFEVTEFHVEGITLDKEPEKEMTKEGLQYTWYLKDIEPKQKVEINYDLRRRVSRTVIVPVQDQLKVIKTHSNLEFLNVEGLFDAKLKFVNHFGDNIKGIIIEDIIPLYYLYNIKYPDNQKPKGIDKSNNGALVKWNIKEFDKEQVAIHQYRLMEIYKFEELKIETRTLSKHAITFVRNRKYQNSIEQFDKILNKLKTYSS